MNLEKPLGALLIVVGVALLLVHPANRLRMTIGGALTGVGLVAPWLVRVKTR